MNNTGQNWLLLRGLARESGHWGDFFSKLQRECPHATINTLDLPGTGRFNNLPSPNTIEEIVKFNNEELEFSEIQYNSWKEYRSYYENDIDPIDDLFSRDTE